jgi:type IV secretory pathway VirB2 component (pilin)
LLLHIMLSASHASISGSLADPVGSSVLVAAVSWLQATLLGTVATTIAIIAIASVGLMMLSGRVNIRYGLTVIAGSFILFGAGSIVAGIQSTMVGGPARYALAPAIAPPPLAPPPIGPQPTNNDPYAGASVPTR